MRTLFAALILFISLVTSAQEIKEAEVSIGPLKGTLSTPSSPTKTVIMLISGSGPTDRDGNSQFGFVNNSLKMVAEAFTQSGYAVLRYDKRGIAKSAAAVSDPTATRFEDFVSDARSWLAFLKEEGFKKIVIAGHSQGSLVGMLAAQNNKRVIGFISIAGLSTDAGEAIVRQLSQQFPALTEEVNVKVDSIRKGHEVKRYNPLLISLFNPQIQLFLSSYIAYNPHDEIKKLEIPVLIVNGTSDLQVTISDAQSLHEGYDQSQLLIIEEMNHVLKHASKDNSTENMATYNIPDLELKEGLMEGMIQFIQKL